jgi:hypothetical protein
MNVPMATNELIKFTLTKVFRLRTYSFDIVSLLVATLKLKYQKFNLLFSIKTFNHVVFNQIPTCIEISYAGKQEVSSS